MGKLMDWLISRKDEEPLQGDPLVGEIGGTYTQADARNALPGHLPFPGSDVELVGYRQGEDLIVLVNKGPCVFRTRLVGAFRDDLDRMTANLMMHDDRVVPGEVPEGLAELAKKLLR